MIESALGIRRLTAGAGLAFAVANGRYWVGVAPIVREQLRRWRLRASEIDDPELRALALSKLDGESFHAEAAAMLATFAPRARRSGVVEAIVALELLFDYLDGLNELPCADPLGEGNRQFGALRSAVAVPPTTEPIDGALCNDGGYLEELSAAVSAAIAGLPAISAVAEVAQRIASRAGNAQTRMHAVRALGPEQLEGWARAHAEETGLGWRELVAGSASSVLVLHVLLAAAADPRTTRGAASRIDEAYLSICVLLTLLDGLVDHEADRLDDRPCAPGYLSLYEQTDELADTIVALARRAVGQAGALPDGPRHLMLLISVVAYYSSAPGAESEIARPVIDRLRRELAPLISPALGVMRAWRRRSAKNMAIE
jgi:tetraprenyl-beta-curcumene synthase